ncbi:MAG: radical SAM protein [Dehalococcoidales bacterium]|nr:radical SAM protein [Dehalococcoidales bacterium]
METFNFQPGYVALYKSGELESRVKRLEERLASCDLCPRNCRVNRLEGKLGACRSGQSAIVASYCAHRGEEPALSGSRGSGTIFFGNCTMRCVYCQNHQISQDYQAQQSNEISTHTLAGQMLYLQNELKCHNINLVSPSHFVPQIGRALLEAVPMGLRLPLLYNTSGYESLETLRELDGLIDIYLPDLRYASDECGKKLSGVPDYVSHARAAIREMYRQVGGLQLDENGVARKGLIVRFLILPDNLAGCVESLTWLAREVSPTVTVSVMAQYFPAHKAKQMPRLARGITPDEYTEVVETLEKLGLENGWVQELGAGENYQPDFSRQGHPFEPAVDA